MKESRPKSSPARHDSPLQPSQPKGAPIGTHSLTGGGAAVGIPETPGRDEHKRPAGAQPDADPKRTEPHRP